ncbi:MAG TPA: UDP-N-acetylmuramoyl-tripeptide--D-alanyl-D-alanine ligase [Paenibacillaceae bacterium]|nr:UDP-N-acetylmuramoyl-tripeptide--D-alanyl-D-alanine ligase [Paenibacillaceae bacterium]
MIHLHLQDLLEKIKGKVVEGPVNPQLTNATVLPNKLKSHGVLFNTHNYKTIDCSHLKNGAAWVIITEKKPEIIGNHSGVTLVIVQKIRKSYWKFIEYYQSLFDIPIIGVTGTCGKSTTKDMIRHILKQKYKNVVSTYKSRNGLTMNLPYLTKIDEKTDAAVIEMGIAHPNDLLVTCRYFRPQIGIITTIGVDPLDQFKDQDHYIQEKGTFLKGLGNQGTLIINGDNENIKKIDMSQYQGDIITFGQEDSCHYKASKITYGNGGMEFILHTKGMTVPVYVPGYGEHNVYNAMAALAAVALIGFDIKKSAKALASFEHIERHIQFYKGMKGCTLIDDTWSSNPTSLEAALKVVKKFSQDKKNIVVMGRIALLGNATAKIYTQVGRMLNKYGVDTLITIGNRAKAIGDAAMKHGMDKKSVFVCRDATEVYNLLQTMIDENTVVLLKNSMIDSASKGLAEKLRF